MTAQRPNPFGVVRQLLIEHGGGFLRNVRWMPGVTCSRCAGIPSTGYDRCRSCDSLALLLHKPDRLGFVTYAYLPHQSGNVMYRYKDPSPPVAATRVLTLALAYALTRHLGCAAASGYGPPDSWAVIPSLKRDGPHPLAGLAAPWLRELRTVDLSKAPGATPTRDHRPQNFRVGSDVTGRHVLLLDDTWASGGHAHSAAAALKQAGAARVTVLVLARWLDPTWSHTRTFIANELAGDFNPDICPFTGTAC